MTGTAATLHLRGPGLDAALAAKREGLAAILSGMGRTLVAYSGGVDSALLLAEARRVLGAAAEGAIADSPSLPRAELEAALALATSRGIPVRIVATRELERAAYRSNAPDRCYHCKAELFGRLSEIALGEGWNSLAYGAVTDDLGEDRPGMSAAAEYGIRAPLVEAGIGKLEGRVLARAAGLPVWEKPQSACLASRIPHGTPVTAERLDQVERAEARLRAAFALRVLRVRHGGGTARIEVSEGDVARLSTPDAAASILLQIGDLGFTSVEIRGYRRPDPLPTDPPEVLVHAESR